MGKFQNKSLNDEIIKNPFIKFNNEIIELPVLIRKKKNMKTKVSIIRFKPKPDCFDEFLENVKERSKERALSTPPTHYLMTTPDEVVAIVLRTETELSESSSRGVNWLDTQRHLLLEYNEEDRHSIPLTGSLVEY